MAQAPGSPKNFNKVTQGTLNRFMSVENGGDVKGLDDFELITFLVIK